MDQLLHLPTIMVIHALSTLISAVLIGHRWRQRPQSRLLGVLTFAAGIAFLGTVLHAMRGVMPFWVSTGLGLGAATVALGLYWQAIVIFDGRRPNYAQALAGAAIWWGQCLTPIFQTSITFRTVTFALILGIYSVLSGREVARGGQLEPLPSRRLAALVHYARGGVWFFVLFATLVFGPAYGGASQFASWFVLASLVQTMLMILSIITLLMLALERDERESRLVSERDPLTNLRNRRSFVERAEAVLAGEGRSAALLLFDIDHFKLINDTRGHAAGDQVLTAFAASLDASMKEDWLLARIGGEEFACLMPGVAGVEAVAIAETLRRRIEALQVLVADRNVPVTVSIGVATTEDVSASLDPLLAAADGALYRAKGDGRNCVRTIDPVVALRRMLEANVERAQPLVGKKAVARGARGSRRR